MTQSNGNPMDVVLAEPDTEAEPLICTSPLGGECLEDQHCEEGVCLISEYAPFGVCTVECQSPGDFCVDTEGNAVEGFWCIQPPPEEFRKLTHTEIDSFCVPICDSLEECKLLEERYETCAQPEYKGNPLYPGSPMPVCLNSGAMGKSPVDPYTCANWKATNPGEPESKQLCANYCAYLSSCQVYASGESLECCEWYCFNRLVQPGFIDGEYQSLLRNFTEWFSSFAGTGKQCEAEEDFGPPPVPDSNKPKPEDFFCEE